MSEIHSLGQSYVVGVDLGGTKILAGVVDHVGNVQGHSKRSTPTDGNAAIVEAIVEAIEAAVKAADARWEDMAGVGIGSPGPLDTERGYIPFSANMNVRDFALGPDVSSRIGRPVWLQNDVRVGGYGEYRLGAGRGHRSLLAAFVGTGIGGCIILDGKVLTGATGNAGEIGHMVLKPGGPRCGCGQRGCLEALASRTAITRRLRKAIRKGAESSLAGKLESGTDKLKSKDLASAFHSGDPLVVKEVTRAATMLGLGLGSLVNILGPEVVILGGGVTEALGEPYIRLVENIARQRILADPHGTILFRQAALGDEAGVVGAALLAREQLEHPRPDNREDVRL